MAGQPPAPFLELSMEFRTSHTPALLATCTPHLTFKELVLHRNHIRCYFKNLFSYVLWFYVLNAKLNHPGSPRIWRTFLTVHREPFNLLWAFSTTKGLDLLFALLHLVQRNTDEIAPRQIGIDD